MAGQRESGVLDIEMRELQGRPPLAEGAKRTFWERVAEFNDPQRALGAGISSYHQQLVQFFFLFVVLVCLQVPVMTIYNSYGYYEDPMLSLSLGNMGFSVPSCTIESMARASSSSAVLDFQCTTGTISALTDFGITTMFEDQQACSRQRSTQYCNQFLHDTGFKEFFNGQCKG